MKSFKKLTASPELRNLWETNASTSYLHGPKRNANNFLLSDN